MPSGGLPTRSTAIFSTPGESWSRVPSTEFTSMSISIRHSVMRSPISSPGCSEDGESDQVDDGKTNRPGRGEEAEAMSRRRIAPGPYGHPLFGCGHRYARDPLAFNTEASRRYGGVVRIRGLPGFYFFMVSDPDAVEHVLHANQKNYRKPALFTSTV